MEKKREKKPYKKPKMTYQKKIETLAVVCDSSWIGPGGSCCMKMACSKRAS